MRAMFGGSYTGWLSLERRSIGRWRPWRSAIRSDLVVVRVVVTRMAAKFQPPAGEIVAVRVAAVLVRTAKGDEGLRCERWELVLAEVEYVPGC